MNLTIEGFWKPRLNVTNQASESLTKGWQSLNEGLDSFMEAPLALSTELSANSDLEHSSILLVSAPGAVGKSTLARQIAFKTGAIYLDLATADPVGANTLSGGLARSRLYQKWEDESTAVLIDGLDEARLRVTQEALEAFLSDVAQVSLNRRLPTVLFGRTGAIQDAWLVLIDQGVGLAVLEIGYYGPEKSVAFAEARLRAVCPDSSNAKPQRKAVKLLLARLRERTEIDGDRFAGYAPVLQAVADRVAIDRNPSALVAKIERGEQPVTLQGVVSSILERERGKLDKLPFEEPTLTSSLYSPGEQLDRLVARVYNAPPPDLPAMGPKDAQIYDTALDTWVAEHPFLDGYGRSSSAVFEAMISVHALQNTASADTALQRELGRGAAANPFLFEFYSESHAAQSSDSGAIFLPPQHIGVVYASLRAQLSLGDKASLIVEGREDAKEEEVLRANVEISLDRLGADRPRVLNFESDQTGPIRMGAHFEDVDITAPHAQVEIGPGAEAVLVAPVSIQCEKLLITTEKVIVESPADRLTNAVFLEAGSFESPKMASVPIVRGAAVLAASWPNVLAHPWTSFATEPTPIDDPRAIEALRRLRRIVISFRSHGQGRLGRFKAKIEHARMTKEAGQAILDAMLKEGILSLEGSMYFLDPDKLMANTGANYFDCMARRFGPQAIAFTVRALGAAD